jgi:hypothetical protein
VKVAARVMAAPRSASCATEGLLGEVVTGDHIAVKEAVLPFNRFPDADRLLGPEMRSTGEVMGIDLTFGLAFAKSSWRPATACPSRHVFLSLADRDKVAGIRGGPRATSASASSCGHRRHRRPPWRTQACRSRARWPSWPTPIRAPRVPPPPT